LHIFQFTSYFTLPHLTQLYFNIMVAQITAHTYSSSPETPTATAATNKAMTALAAQDKLVDKLVA
jgi:hypothetical protein